MEKKSLLIESCENCYLHPKEEHYESDYQNYCKALEMEIDRFGKNIQINKNSNGLKPRINSFQVIYKDILIYSKLKHLIFPKIKWIGIIITAIQETKPDDLDRLKIKVLSLDMDLYSILLTLYKKISLKATYQFINSLRPRVLVCSRINQQKRLFRSKSKKKPKNLPHKNQIIVEQENHQNQEDLSIRLNTQSTVVQGLDAQQKSVGVTKISGFIKQLPSLKKGKKYMYLSKEMDVQIGFNEFKEETQVGLEELSEEQVQRGKKKQTTQKTNGRFLKAKKKSFLNIKVDHHKKKSSQEDQYKINVNYVQSNNKISVNQESSSSSSSSSIDSILSPSDYEMPQSNTKIQTSIQRNSKNFKFQPEEINTEFRIVKLSKFMELEDLQYLNHYSSTQISNENIVQNALLFLYAHFPSQINRIFKYDLQSMNERENIQNYSPILFNRLTGKFQVIIVNNEFAMQRTSNKFIFQNPIHNQCWMVIIEKALAKLEGGYKKLHEDLKIQDLLKILTGAPLIVIETVDLQKVKKVIYLNHFMGENKKGRVLCIGKNVENNLVQYWLPELVDFNLNHSNFLKSEVKVQLSSNLIQTYTYDEFSIFFDSFILWLQEKDYFHNQLHIIYKPQRVRLNYNDHGNCQSANQKAWKIVLLAREETHAYLEFTQINKKDKKTIIRVYQMKELQNQEIADEKQDPMKSQNSLKEYFRAFQLKIVGEIKRNKSFFFQADLQPCYHLIQIQRQFESEESNSFHVYSGSEIVLKDSVITCHEVLGLTNNDQIYLKS